MRTASPSRRTAALLAVTTIGLSTAVLSVTGAASAAGVPSMSFTTASGASTSGPVPEGICAIAWRVTGGQGGVDSNAAAGEPGGELVLTSIVEAGDAFTLSPGDEGATDAAGEDSVVSAGGVDLITAGGGSVAGGAAAANDYTVDAVSSQPFYDSGATTGNTATGSNPTGDGVITGTGVLCSAPPAPHRSTVDASVGDDESVGLSFFAPVTSWEGEPLNAPNGIPYQDVDGYEIQVDGGSWAPITPTANPHDPEDEALYATVDGLGDGSDHTVRFRATSLVGPSAASEPITVTYERTYPAPTDVTVKTGVKSLTVSWKAPADTTGITGYWVEAYPQYEGDPEGQDLEMGDCETTADDLNCTFPVKAGWDYVVIVGAMADAAHYRSEPSAEVHSGKVPGFVAPAAVPTASAPLTTTDADKTLKAGELVTLSGTGYLPHSSVDLVMYSAPQLLKTVTTDASGNFSTVVTVPTGLANGTHHLVAAGVDGNGNPRYLVLEVTVTGGVAALTGGAPAGVSLAATGGTPAKPAAAGSGGLAYTGFSALPFVGAGLLGLVAGGGLLLVSRRRRA